MGFVFMPCFHCAEPWCVPVCPTGAMRKRPKDGIVYVEQSLCVGCKSCITACPWGAPQWQPQIGKVVKCDYCMDRVDQGLKPACVTKCVTHCLHFGVADQSGPDPPGTLCQGRGGGIGHYGRRQVTMLRQPDVKPGRMNKPEGQSPKVRPSRN